jgi:succinyl-CoA synthetase beta subunit
VKQAFKIILSDERVKAIFVNIFGGILRCDVLAEGVCGAAKEMGIKVPLVVRLEGTNVEIGRKILADSGLKIHSAKDMGEGAKTAVELARGPHPGLPPGGEGKIGGGRHREEVR